MKHVRYLSARHYVNQRSHRAAPSAQPRALEESGSVIWRLRRGGTTHFPDLVRRTADVFDLTEEAIEVDVAVFVEPLPRGELLGR